MARPSELGKSLQRLRAARGLSAYALAKTSGLSLSYIRMVERGQRHPSPSSLAALCGALQLDALTVSALRRLAGIDPDPASTPESKCARRKAWRPLLYVLVNHVLLPRLAVGKLLEGKRRLHDRDRDLISRAAAASDVTTFVDQTSDAAPPSPAVLRLLEETFGGAQPVDIVRLQRHICGAQDARRPQGPGREHGVPYRWDQRWAFARILLAFNHPTRPESQLHEYVHKLTFDYNFAVAFFPLIYWHSCREWPFEKVLMPYARHGPETQRQLYDAARGGLPLEDFDRALIGAGDLGALLAGQRIMRPSPEDVPGADGDDWVKLAMRTPGRTYFSSGPRSVVDSLFDHLDRCEFLERFPLLKVDRQGAAELAKSVTLPSWSAWTEWFSQWNWPSDTPPLGAERFAYVLSQVRTGCREEASPATLDSYITRRLIEEAADALARVLGRGQFDRAVSAADILEFHPAWLGLLRALAGETPAAPPDRSASGES